MAADALDIRMARLEGAYEQINKRLETLHVDVQEIRGDLRRLDTRIDSTFRWVIGIILANWITLMLAILLRR